MSAFNLSHKDTKALHYAGSVTVWYFMLLHPFIRSDVFWLCVYALFNLNEVVTVTKLAFISKLVFSIGRQRGPKWALLHKVFKLMIDHKASILIQALKPGLSILFESGPIRTHVCLRTKRACIQTNKQRLAVQKMGSKKKLPPGRLFT